jgi:hypothetical protein
MALAEFPRQLFVECHFLDDRRNWPAKKAGVAICALMRTRPIPAASSLAKRGLARLSVAVRRRAIFRGEALKHPLRWFAFQRVACR